MLRAFFTVGIASAFSLVSTYGFGLRLVDDPLHNSFVTWGIGAVLGYAALRRWNPERFWD